MRALMTRWLSAASLRSKCLGEFCAETFCGKTAADLTAARNTFIVGDEGKAMYETKNETVRDKLVVADIQGWTRAQMKPIVVEANIFDIDPDTPIFRIVDTHLLLDDIAKCRLSHSAIGEDSWGDPAENPLKTQQFVDQVTGVPLYLDSLVNDLYGSCWSLHPTATQEMWTYFSYGNLSVRIETTPRKLLDAVMDVDNNLISLQHFIGKMTYVDSGEFDRFFSDPDYQKHLDPNGQRLALSVLRLPDGPQAEQEVRLVYMADRNQPWTKNVHFSNRFAFVPCQWAGLIQSVVVGSHIDPADVPSLTAKLQSLRITCSVSRSPSL